MQLTDLIKNLDYNNIYGNTNIPINNIQYDSRKVEKGDLFVAINGQEADGHKYIESAVSFGAAAVICQVPPTQKYDNVCIVVVDNSRKALARIASNFFGNPSEELSIIGVTGTNGKTSVTFLINKLLAHSGHDSAIIGTTGIYLNDEKLDATLTTPDPISMNKILRDVVNRGVRIVIMEVSSHALEQNRADYIDFDIAIFTNLTHDHLDYHKTFEAYSEAKKRLFDNLKPNATAILNVDDAGYKEIVSDSKASTILVGWDVNANYQIKNEKISHEGSTFTVEYGENDFSVKSPLVAHFNIINLVLSIVATSQLLRVTFQSIASDLSYITTAPGRMERVPLNNGAVAVIDYAHTPDALEKAGKACKQLLTAPNARLITVFGCGGDRDKSKRPHMAAAAEKYANRIIITDDNPRTESRQNIFHDIEKGMKNPGNYLVIKDRADAIKEAVKSANKGDIILIAGKGHETYQIIGTQKIHFDDKEIVLSV